MSALALVKISNVAYNIFQQAVHQLYDSLNKARQENWEKNANRFSHVLPDDDSKDFNLFQVRGKFVVRDNPPFSSQKNLNPFLLDFRVRLLEAVGEPE